MYLVIILWWPIMVEWNPNGDRIRKGPPPSSLDTGGGEDEDWGLSRALAEVSEVEMGRRWVARESERENDSEHRFKPCGVEADWLNESGREDNWTREMMSVLGLTAWESGRHHWFSVHYQPKLMRSLWLGLGVNISSINTIQFPLGTIHLFFEDCPTTHWSDKNSCSCGRFVTC